MTTFTTAATLAISGPRFLWGYGVLCVVAAIAIWRRRRRALGPAERSRDPLPSLGVYQLAMLSDGPRLAITSAAAQLRRDGLLEVDASSGRLTATGAVDSPVDPLERAVFDAVRRDPAITAHALRAEVAESDPVRSMTARLTDVGLLLDEQQSRPLRRLWFVGAALAALGSAWILAGSGDGTSVGWVVAIVLVVALATLWLMRQRPHATNRGREVLRRSRAERVELRRNPTAGQSALTAALFGGGTLWLTDPAMASALDVPREDGRSSGHGTRCGAGGGCGSGGGGSGSSCGGGGCGGGGCGGG